MSSTDEVRGGAAFCPATVEVVAEEELTAEKEEEEEAEGGGGGGGREAMIPV